MRTIQAQHPAARKRRGGREGKEIGIVSNEKRPRFQTESVSRRLAIVAGLLLPLALPPTMFASEDVPHRPFAYWADLPEPGQFIFGMVYEESEAYHIWAANKNYNVTVEAGGEKLRH